MLCCLLAALAASSCQSIREARSTFPLASEDAFGQPDAPPPLSDAPSGHQLAPEANLVPIIPKPAPAGPGLRAVRLFGASGAQRATAATARTTDAAKLRCPLVGVVVVDAVDG